MKKKDDFSAQCEALGGFMTLPERIAVLREIASYYAVGPNRAHRRRDVVRLARAVLALTDFVTEAERRERAAFRVQLDDVLDALDRALAKESK
jgi:hypothetical protein